MRIVRRACMKIHAPVEKRYISKNDRPSHDSADTFCLFGRCPGAWHTRVIFEGQTEKTQPFSPPFHLLESVLLPEEGPIKMLFAGLGSEKLHMSR